MALPEICTKTSRRVRKAGRDRPAVAITATSARPVAVDVVRRILGRGVDLREVEFPDGPLTRMDLDKIVDELRGAAAVFMRTGRLSADTLRKLPTLRIVAVHGAGVDQVDIKEASVRGIYVTNAPGGNSQAVAEYVFALLLGLARAVPRADRLVRQGQWEAALVHGKLLHGKVLGVLGFGHIGRRVARIAHGFDMTVIAHDPLVEAAVLRELGVEPTSLEALLQQADIVTVHLPLTEQTVDLLDHRRLTLMKPGAFLVNTARGEVVDEEALADVLNSGQLGGAAMDTFRAEPLSPTSPLLKFENVLVSPHMAGAAHEVLIPIAETAALDIRTVLNDREPVHWVNRGLMRGQMTSHGGARQGRKLD